MIVDWLTLVTEFIGMTSALSIFGIAPWITVAGVVTLMGIIVINGRYWTWVSGAQRGVVTAHKTHQDMLAAGEKPLREDPQTYHPIPIPIPPTDRGSPKMEHKSSGGPRYPVAGGLTLRLKVPAPGRR